MVAQEIAPLAHLVFSRFGVVGRDAQAGQVAFENRYDCVAKCAVILWVGLDVMHHVHFAEARGRAIPCAWLEGEVVGKCCYGEYFVVE
jgi:hypothetical protein